MYQIVSTLGLIYALAVDVGPNNAVNVFEDDVANLENPSVLYLEDSSGELELEDILKESAWVPLSKAETNQGLTESSFWLKFEIHNASIRTINRWITVGNEVPYNIQFWLRSNGQTLQHYQGGSIVDFDSRILKTSLEGMPTQLAPNETLAVYIRVANLRTTDLTVRLLPLDSLMKFERRRTLEAGIFIGAMVLIIIYNLVLGFRQSLLFLIHAGFSTTILFLFTRPNGLTFEYLWPNTGELDATSGPIIASVSMLTALLFLISYFNLEKVTPRLSIFLKVCAVLPLLAVVFLHLLPHQVIASSLTKILAVEALIWMGVTLWAIQKRMDGSLEYAANWGLFIICGVVYASWLQGYSSNFYAAGYIIKLSAIVQAAGLSYSARRRIQRSQELGLETKQTIETVRKIQQVNQLNDLLHSL
ncbi:MAG: 7TM-DISM domain-containing protein, partial [Myxococcota bacterium]|nr:7TM-DISM domain-containing protein [Myxococcota bacterium]